MLELNFGAYAKDIKLNLSTVLSEDSSTGLSLNQTLSIALVCAYATRHSELIKSMSAYVSDKISAAEIEAAKSAATIMAMNNIYYRFTHLVNDAEYQTMPARLRMTIIGNPGVDKKDFELYAIAVSAINGCGLCMESHAKKLLSEGVSKASIQAAVRIAAVVSATAQALVIN